ncbi:MAG: sensor histidine kinase [Rhodothermaceae bacterium]
MKLINKITLNFFLVSSLIILISGVAAYFFLRHEVDEKVDYKIYDEKREVIRRFAENYSEMTSDYKNLSIHLNIEKTTFTNRYWEEIKDTLIPAPRKHKHSRYKPPLQSYRQLRFNHTINGETYVITLRKLLVDSEDLIEALERMLIFVLSFLLVCLGIMNYLMSKKTWTAFSDIVNQVTNFNITKGKALELPHSDILEIKNLNKAINEMTEKVGRDYSALKEFSENASHELQTPISVIQSEIELMIQEDSLDSEKISHLQNINQATTKLARLNQALLLLTKIENGQFTDFNSIQITELIDKNLNNFTDMAELRNISFDKNYHSSPVLKLHSHLADILIGNLLKNAVKYCSESGKINITVNESSFSISNPGAELKVPPEDLFNRFKKADQASKSLGLGLSIVKKICELYNLKIEYLYSDQNHTIKIYF